MKKNARQWNGRNCHFSDAILRSPPHHTPQLFQVDLMQQTFHPARRSFVFAGAAGASLTILPALIPSAFGKAPMAGSQAISVHRMKLGEFEITAMLDGYLDVPPSVLQADPELVKTLLLAGGYMVQSGTARRLRRCICRSPASGACAKMARHLRLKLRHGSCFDCLNCG